MSAKSSLFALRSGYLHWVNAGLGQVLRRGQPLLHMESLHGMPYTISAPYDARLEWVLPWLQVVQLPKHKLTSCRVNESECLLKLFRLPPIGEDTVNTYLYEQMDLAHHMLYRNRVKSINKEDFVALTNAVRSGGFNSRLHIKKLSVVEHGMFRAAQRGASDQELMAMIVETIQNDGSLLHEFKNRERVLNM
jgi:hypothetical protein